MCPISMVCFLGVPSQVYFPCMPHNLQLTIESTFEMCTTYGDIISRVGRIVSKCQRSQYIIKNALQEFGKTVQRNNVTRWNSTLLMVSSVLKLTPEEIRSILKIANTINKKKRKRISFVRAR